jgi:hypothetical protein
LPIIGAKDALPGRRIPENRESESRGKVFISYSRSDKAFASDLVLGLTACGFEAYIDREDIAAGEVWEQRLSGLISEADTIVYVLSPDSLGSKQCAWELQASLASAKRILPVVWRPVDEAATPAELKRLNYIFFSGEGRSFAAGLAELAQALRVDIDWIREHTRIAALAARWSGRARSEALLLRGDELDTARDWSARKPVSAPVITDEQADFIKASSDARAEAERRAQRAKAGLLTAVSVVAVMFAGLAALAGWQWKNAVEAEVQAKKSRDAAIVASRSLEEANLRLNAEISLRTAPADDGYFIIDAGWYPVAANFSGAVARVDRSGGGKTASIASGFAIDGGLIHPKYAGEALLLAPVGNETAEPYSPPAAPAPGVPSDTLPADAPLQPQRMLASSAIDNGPAKISVSFPTLGGEVIAGAEVIWKTPDHMGGAYPFEIWRLGAALPRGARMITKDDVDCQGFERTPPRRIIGSFGIAIPAEGGPSPKAVTLNISQLIDRTDPYSMRYTHATNFVSQGAPVFDLMTGDVFAIHLSSGPDPAKPGRRIGYGFSLQLVLDMARQKLGDQSAQLGPICDTAPT